ncbi:glycosyl hydrolase family 28-related protein [Paraflavitalea sp. CAU 1676]|uniref:glycosyl hydrolase family 28-related protein n=1 Tax=Paraflavitalea sp. CAU 1676 TaxID=3032598 RepID=UPI0023DBE089|nr:glycosyl hydrolase family 28-related protein [Paraflavitalea sp. CAU 1676]MDF2191816.1 glycosyl hydrolase family 28-related protein [Paraflavitalea sp. CAU 1676]
MSNTYTGVIDPAVIPAAQAAQMFPNDRQGTLVELASLPAGASVDGIFYLNGTAGTYLKRVMDGPVRAVHCGIYGDGTDQTLKINTAFTHAGITEIVFDYAAGADIVVNGTVTIPAGKRIVFRSGNKLTGSGTINGGIIDAGYDQQIFATSLTVNPSGITTDKVSAKWFGAKGDNSTDDTVALQKAIDCVVRNSGCGGHLFIPAGRYKTTKGLLAFKDMDANGVPESVNIRISGTISAYISDSFESVIVCYHTDNFGLAIQRGKGCIVEYLTIQGPNVLNYPLATAWNASTSYKINSSIRDNAYSPFAGIVLDPFHSNVNGTDRYPGFESYYAAVTGNGGSTDCKFLNCSVNGFYVGIILTPNYGTQNNESHLFDGIWLSNCRDGVVTTNSQERQTKCTNFKIWNSVRTCFRTNGYGANRGDVPAIDNLNVAGNIYELFYFSGTGGYFSHLRAKNIHAESFRRIGVLFTLTAEIADSHFNLLPSAYDQTTPDWFVTGFRIKFTNSVIVSYDGGIRIPLNIAAAVSNTMVEFDNCLLSNQVASVSNPNWTLDDHNITYRKCSTYVEGGKMNDDKFISSQFSNYRYFGYGSQLEFAGFGKEIVSSAYGTYPRKYWHQKRRVLSPLVRRIYIGQVAVTVAGNKLSATATIAGLPKLYEGLLVHATGLNIPVPEAAITMDSGQIMRVKDINTTTGVVTFDRLIDSLTTGSYFISVEVIAPVSVVTVGSISGNTATNVITEGSTTTNSLTGPVWVVADGFANSVASGTSSTITFNYNVPYPQDRAIIASYEYEESGQSYMHPLDSSFVPLGTVFTKGALYTNSDSATANVAGWLCTRTGVKGSSIPPEFKVIYATDNNNTSVTLNANGSVAIPAGELVSYIVVKTANAATSFKIGTTAGGGEIEPGVNLPAGNAKTWNPGLYFSVAGTLYFTNVPVGTEILIKKA